MAITFEFEFVDDVIVSASNCGKKFNIINIIKVTIKNRQSRHTGRRQTKQLNNPLTLQKNLVYPLPFRRT
jgi:hypothetical protein